MCGIVGVYNVPHAATVCRTLLRKLQHRGEESCGIAVISDDGALRCDRKKGWVKFAFPNGVEEYLPGSLAVGHVRYSTTGESNEENIQPIKANYPGGDVAIAHNGNFPTFRELRERLGGFHQTTTDTEIIFHLMHISPRSDLEQKIVDAAQQVEGAYSQVLLTKEKLYAMRDPRGFRPLSIGALGDGFIVSSEAYAFAKVGASFIREVEPGEMVVFEQGGPRSVKIPHTVDQTHYCIFELFYFMHPTSQAFGVDVTKFRLKSGKILAREELAQSPVKADVVCGVPDSGGLAATGYALERKEIPLIPGALVRDHYEGKTFILPNQRQRQLTVEEKIEANASIVKGKRVIIIDDSIVRGNTMRRIVGDLYKAKAAEVHVRIASPMIMSRCLYGIDFKAESELIASEFGGDMGKIAEFLGCNSLHYLSLAGLMAATGKRGPMDSFCSSCFTGQYPFR